MLGYLVKMNVNRILNMLGEYAVIDANGHVLGRLSSIIAKRLLNGESIVVVNAEKAVVTGEKYMVFARYKEKYNRGSQEKGPYFPRHPERIFKRTVKSMLPRKSRRGREAYKRLKVFIGIPSEIEEKKLEVVEHAMLERISKAEKYVTLGEISKHLGYKVRE
jgi:large subunit ribosomal protein L13